MAEVWVNQFTLALRMKKKTDGSAIPYVGMVTLALALFVGKIAHLISETTVLTVQNLLLTAVALARLRNATTARSTDCCGIPSVVMDITMLVAVFALQTANMV